MNTRKVLTWGFITVAAGLTVYAVVKKVKIMVEKKKLEKILAEQADVLPPTPQPAANDNFPLKKGSKGTKVTNIQAKLDIQPNSGYFGDLTAAMIQTKYGVSQVDSALYDKIMASKPLDNSFIVYDLGILSATAAIKDYPANTGKTVKTLKKGDYLGTVMKSLYNAAPANSYIGLMGSQKLYVVKKDTLVYRERPYNK